MSNWEFKDETVLNSFTIPSGTIIEPGDYLVLCEEIDTFDMIYPDVTNRIGPFEFGLNNTAGGVRFFDADNVLKLQVNYVDSMPWPAAADGLGPSLELLSSTSTLVLPSSWFPGCVGGSPGKAYDDCDYDIIVSEINYNSASFFNPGDWFELYNKSSVSIDISNWEIRDNNDNNKFKIPAGEILLPEQRLVYGDSLAVFSELFPSVLNLGGEITYKLSNNGDAIRIYNTEPRLQYSVRFNDDAPWPVDADGNGFTLEYDESKSNPNLATSWFAGCLYGSPGVEFMLPCGTAIQYENLNNLFGAPNPFNSNINITAPELIIEYSIYNLAGKQILNKTCHQFFINWDGKDGQLKNVSNGIYFMHLYASSGNRYHIKIVKI